MPDNLYVHFPFCRRKCTYCALYSRPGVDKDGRDTYVQTLVTKLSSMGSRELSFRTIYFGGGTPALCDLEPFLKILRGDEFTVELHPLDVTDDLLRSLMDGGVNRISMGVQSLNDKVLANMGRGYTFAEAERAFMKVREVFDNAGIDLIVGYPGDDTVSSERCRHLERWGLRHCSVYSLQNERGLKNVPDDDTVLDGIASIAELLRGCGLERYEISNYAVPGYECKHNLAVWRGEDYLGIGDGAHGRIGLMRTPSGETVSPEADLKERTIFRLRTREGLDASRFPEWTDILDRYCAKNLLERDGDTYRLTERGTEVCDSILADLI